MILDDRYNDALTIAKSSPCKRRKYGAIVFGPDAIAAFATNYRVSRCCTEVCARTRYTCPHGQRTEVGAEIHAETALLIRYGTKLTGDRAMLAAIDTKSETELLGTRVYPCHTCALNLKFAGFTYLYMKDLGGQVGPVSLAEIIEYREKEWDLD